MVQIILVGVAHVLDIEDRIREILEREQPNAVAIELDPSRLYALLNPEARGRGDLMSRVLSGMEERMADEYGVMPGSEMLAAYAYARDKNVPLYLIDRNITEIMNSIKSIGFWERTKLLFSGLTSSLIPKKRLEKEMRALMDNYDAAIGEFRKSFPRLTKALIDDRNEHMTNELIRIGAEKVVAVVGDAHVEGLSEGLQKAGADLIEVRLRDIVKKPANLT